MHHGAIENARGACTKARCDGFSTSSLLPSTQDQRAFGAEEEHLAFEMLPRALPLTMVR
jgi:hypothetical protein